MRLDDTHVQQHIIDGDQAVRGGKGFLHPFVARVVTPGPSRVTYVVERFPTRLDSHAAGFGYRDYHAFGLCLI